MSLLDSDIVCTLGLSERPTNIRGIYLLYYEKIIRRIYIILTFMFDNVEELVKFREECIEKYNEVPRISAVFHGNEHTYFARVNM